MPHFVIECSRNILQQQPADVIMNTVYHAAESTGLFAENDIKVRINSYEHYRLGEGKDSFLHIFASIMGGRTPEQRANLSRVVIRQLAPLLPDISFLSMNVSEFDPATYSNRSLIDPLNTEGNRHF
ncbi:5-carboxymethyl-2-hydroxymuconate Delta-isomerase [Chitinophaga arvensicola]|uniref:5-carboxymethyl-2-hydroxymuconate isomerase n=1 Tax=Chitinophaga arvensicola TaxID=29529 RepID=A0A1I0SCX9_9BACT|nr:5-carboxymethyl-2-hydroxymuconate Delta-isomerase [Chitinophaga arvensicola]SEW53736.1 5-carboxymethyl-2-hydroxymuconate isomerase [Chitinophaga arvensicola]